LFALQNVGAIDNRGWEMQGSAQRGPLSLTTAVTLVDSRVRRLASGYTGDLRVGDRMFDVPSQTLSVTASWARGPWSAVIGGVRAFDWMEYDRLAIAQRLATTSRPPSDLFGTALRAYWRQYDGVTRLRASFSRSLGRGVDLLLMGDNLLGVQRGEPDNLTIVPGRTYTLGFRGVF
jgi:iron complex outermembrane receptor protein